MSIIRSWKSNHFADSLIRFDDKLVHDLYGRDLHQFQITVQATLKRETGSSDSSWLLLVKALLVENSQMLSSRGETGKCVGSFHFPVLEK